MKRIFSFLLMLTLSLSLTLPSFAADPAKTEKRANYTIKNLGLTDAQKKTLKPLLIAYITEMKAAKKTYSDLKEKYDKEITKNSLTDAQAKELLTAKWDSDTKELEIKKSYAKKFAATLSPKKVYRCFDLLNDKKSKVEGSKKNSKKKSADDDDE